MNGIALGPCRPTSSSLLLFFVASKLIQDIQGNVAHSVNNRRKQTGNVALEDVVVERIDVVADELEWLELAAFALFNNGAQVSQEPLGTCSDLIRVGSKIIDKLLELDGGVLVVRVTHGPLNHVFHSIQVVLVADTDALGVKDLLDIDKNGENALCHKDTQEAVEHIYEGPSVHEENSHRNIQGQNQ